MAAGVIKKIGVQDRPYYIADDIQQMLGVGKSKAYQMIRSVRDDLIQSGQLHPSYPNGKVPKTYFNEKFMV